MADARSEGEFPSSTAESTPASPRSRGRIFRSPLFGFLAVFAIALTARLIYLAEVVRSSDFNSLVLDSQWYHVEAIRIGAEGWLPPDAFFRAPGYPYFLALVYGLWGNGLLAARILQIVLASFSAGLVFLLGQRVYGRAVGWLAGILAATYGSFVYFSAEILGTVLVVATSLLAVWLLVRAESGRGPWGWFWAGLALGLSALVRPTILVFAVLAVLWAKGGRPGRSGWGRAGAVVLGLVLCVAPVTVINYRAGGEFVPIAHQGGINYFIGNNAQADGKTAAGPGARDSELLRSVGKTQDTVYLGAKIVAERAVGRSMTPSEVSRFWYDQAWQYVRRNPGDWARLQGRKLYYFWNGYVIDNNRDIGAFLAANSPSLRLPHPGFWLVGPLGLAGLALSFRRGRASQLLALFVVGQTAAVVAFFVCERFRIPVAMVLTILAALAVVTLAGTVRRREWKRVGLWTLALVVLYGVVNTRAMGIERDRDEAVHLFNQASAYMDQGRYDAAIDAYRKVLELDPNDAKTHFSLGSAYLARGLEDPAHAEYRRALALDASLTAAVHNDLGVHSILGGRLDEAERELRAALSADPGYALAGLNLAHIYQRTGRRSLAIEEYERILEMPDVHPEQKSVALAETALAAAEAGRLDEALDRIRRAVRFNPENERARLYRAEILSRSGNRNEAVDEWRKLAAEARDESVRAEAEKSLRKLGPAGAGAGAR